MVGIVCVCVNDRIIMKNRHTYFILLKYLSCQWGLSMVIFVVTKEGRKCAEDKKTLNKYINIVFLK